MDFQVERGEEVSNAEGLGLGQTFELEDAKSGVAHPSHYVRTYNARTLYLYLFLYIIRVGVSSASLRSSGISQRSTPFGSV